MCNYVTTFWFETSVSFHVTVPPQVESDFTSCCCCCWLRLSRPWVATSLLAGRPGGKTPATLQRDGLPKGRETSATALLCQERRCTNGVGGGILRSGQLRSVSLEVQHFVRKRGRRPLCSYLYEVWFLIYDKIVGLFKFDTYPNCDGVAGDPKEIKKN